MNYIRKHKYWFIAIISIVVIIAITLASITYIHIQNKNKELEEQKLIETIATHYNNVVKTDKKAKLYKNSKHIGYIEANIIISLNEMTSKKEQYFTIKDYNYQISYKDVLPTKDVQSKKTLDNYLLFNENIVTKNKVKLYQNNKIVYELNNELSLPIMIKEETFYGVIFNNDYYNVMKEDVVNIISVNNTEEIAETDISVIAYHSFYEDNKPSSCATAVCLSKSKFEQQLKYLQDNKYHTITTVELEQFIDGKVRLKDNSVLLTMDDGYLAINDIAVPLLEKYNMKATLFLITGYFDAKVFDHKVLELQSHTNNMHRFIQCKDGKKSEILCVDKEKGIADLKKSKEIIKGTAFCYPFYEYNDHAISILKEAGFTMGFGGDLHKVKPNTNKYKIPRYSILRDDSLNTFIQYVK